MKKSRGAGRIQLWTNFYGIIGRVSCIEKSIDAQVRWIPFLSWAFENKKKKKKYDRSIVEHFFPPEGENVWFEARRKLKNRKTNLSKDTAN